jgi:hypothetical protein
MKRSILLLLSAVACSSPEFQRDSGMPDADTTDATILPGLVRVTVQDQGYPLANQIVDFRNQDGSEIGVATTDGSGKASMVVPPFSSVTVGVKPGTGQINFYGLTTILGVMPGDNLTFGAPPLGAQNTLGNSTLTFGTFPGTSTYYWYNGCSGNSSTAPPAASPFSLTVYDTCVTGSTVTIAVAAHNSANQTIGFGTMSGTMSGTAPSETTTTAVSVAINAVVDHNSVTVTNTPPLTQDVQVRQLSYHGAGFYDDQWMSQSGGGGATATFGNATGAFIDTVMTDAYLDYQSDSNNYAAESHYIVYGPPPKGTLALDASRNLLPRVYDVNITQPAAGGSPTISWSQAANLFADGVGVELRYSNPAFPSTTFWWSVLFRPGTSPSVALPPLPTQLADWSPPAATSFQVWQFRAVQSPQIGGYDALRPVYNRYLGIDPNRPSNFVRPTGNAVLLTLDVFDNS